MEFSKKKVGISLRTGGMQRDQKGIYINPLKDQWRQEKKN